VPVSFQSAGDISIAYDLQFTNGTAAYIKSDGPFYIDVGDPNQNHDLTLSASGLGEVIVADKLTVTSSVADGTQNSVIENTAADVTSQTWLLTLKYTDDGDTDADFMRALDNVSDVQFQIDSDGKLTTQGDMLVQGGGAEVCAGACPSWTGYVDATAGDIGAEADIHAAGGYKNSFNFGKENVAASQTAVAIYVSSFSETNTEIVMPYAGSVIAISVASNDARTAGTLTVDATINGTATGLQAVLDVTNTTYHYASQAPETAGDTIAAGDRLGVKITTSADWLPTTADIVVTVVIEY